MAGISIASGNGDESFRSSRTAGKVARRPVSRRACTIPSRSSRRGRLGFVSAFSLLILSHFRKLSRAVLRDTRQGAAPAGGVPFSFEKGTERKPGGQHGELCSPIAVPLDPGDVRAAVRFSGAGKTCELLQLVLVWRSNDSGYRPSCKSQARFDSSCVLLGANKPPLVEAFLNRPCAHWQSSTGRPVGGPFPHPPCRDLPC